MSRGTPHVPLRLDRETLALIDAEVRKQNEGRTEEPYSRSTWIRQAIAERLAKLRRGRVQARGAAPVSLNGETGGMIHAPE